MKSEQPPPAISSMPGAVRNTVLDWFVQRAMMREPERRFRSGREMLEHWWNVMASLDGTGDAGIPPGAPSGIAMAGRRKAVDPPRPAPPPFEEERTIRHPSQAFAGPPSTTHPSRAHGCRSSCEV
jgi:hypothetical protein